MSRTGAENPEYAFEFSPAPVPPLARVRSWLRDLLPDATDEARQDVQLVTTELLTNAHEHAAGPLALRLARPDEQPLV